MKKCAYLHIGTEKTGTTTLQQFLFVNRDNLHKVNYFIPNSVGARNNRKIVSYAVSDDRWDDYLDEQGVHTLEQKQHFRDEFLKEFHEEMQKRLGKEDNILLSSEHFSSRLQSVEEIQKIKELLSTYCDDFKIIIYLRDQRDMMPSTYSTILKCGYNATFDEIADKFLEGKSYYYDYAAILHNWIKVFGKDALIVRLFDKNHLIKSDLLSDFLTQIDLAEMDDLFVTENVHKNESINHVGQMLLRISNKYIHRFSSTGKVNRDFAQVNRIIYDNAKGKGQTLTGDQYNQAKDIYKKSNAWVQKEFFANQEDIFPDKDNLKEPTLTKQEEAVIEDVFTTLLKTKVCNNIEVNLIRDAAIAYEEKGDIAQALKLMRLAKKFRPKGVSINKKIQEYRKILST